MCWPSSIYNKEREREDEKISPISHFPFMETSALSPSLLSCAIMKRQHATLSADAVAIQRPITIAFVGERGVGKSGLINAALLGTGAAERDPSYPLPSAFGQFSVTRHFLRVSSSDAASFSMTSPEGVTAALDTMKHVRATLAAFSKLDVETRTFNVTGPFPGLPRHVTLIDCPGWEDAPVAEFYRVLATADAIVTVTARGALVGTDRAMHRPVFLRLAGLGQTHATHALPLFVNACFFGEDDATTAYDVVPIPSIPHARQWPVNRRPFNLGALVHQVDSHGLSERARVAAFPKTVDALALTDRRAATCLFRTLADVTKRAAAREVFENAMYTLNGGLVEPDAFFTVHELCTQDDPTCLLLHLAGAYTTQYLKVLQDAIDGLCRSLDLDPAHFAQWAQRVNTMGAQPVIWDSLDKNDTLPRDADERFFCLSAKFNAYRRDLRKAGEDAIFGFEKTVAELSLHDD